MQREVLCSFSPRHPLFTCPSTIYQFASDLQSFASHLFVKPDDNIFASSAKSLFCNGPVLLLLTLKNTVSHQDAVCPEVSIRHMTASSFWQLWGTRLYFFYYYYFISLSILLLHGQKCLWLQHLTFILAKCLDSVTTFSS